MIQDLETNFLWNQTNCLSGMSAAQELSLITPQKICSHFLAIICEKFSNGINVHVALYSKNLNFVLQKGDRGFKVMVDCMHADTYSCRLYRSIPFSYSSSVSGS